MPSPLPGMDPFLQGPDWEDFHGRFINGISDWLVPQIQPRYVARIELRVYVHMPEQPDRLVRPDVSVYRESTGDRATVASATGVLEPILVTVTPPEELREAYLTIRERATKELVTVIELLSPANKEGSGRDFYLSKRHAVLMSSVNLVEIDLLRGGARLPTDEPLPPADYFAFVSRTSLRPRSELYYWSLRQRLPEIPVPLAEGDADARLDLQAIFDSVYDRAGYGYSLDYDRSPEPPLAADDADWVRECLAKRR